MYKRQVEHDGSELSADDEADSPMAVGMDALPANISGFLSPSKVPHVPHVRPVTPKQVTHHHDDDDYGDDDADVTDDVAEENPEDANSVVNGNVTN